jgi:hypothetical protein
MDPGVSFENEESAGPQYRSDEDPQPLARPCSLIARNIPIEETLHGVPGSFGFVAAIQRHVDNIWVLGREIGYSPVS